MQILGLQAQISKSFSGYLEYFFLTVGQDNFGNKIPFSFLFELLSFEKVKKESFSNLDVF